MDFESSRIIIFFLKNSFHVAFLFSHFLIPIIVFYYFHIGIRVKVRPRMTAKFEVKKFDGRDDSSL